jgi:hypothetical protein
VTDHRIEHYRSACYATLTSRLRVIPDPNGGRELLDATKLKGLE